MSKIIPQFENKIFWAFQTLTANFMILSRNLGKSSSYKKFKKYQKLKLIDKKKDSRQLKMFSYITQLVLAACLKVRK